MGLLDVFKEEFMKGLNQNLKGVSEEEKKKMGFWESVEANFTQGMKEGMQEEPQKEKTAGEEEVNALEHSSWQKKNGVEKYRLGMQAFCSGDMENAMEYFLASAADGNSDAMLVMGDISRKSLEEDLTNSGTIYFSFRLHDPTSLTLAVQFYLSAGYFHADKEEVVHRITLISKYFQDPDQFAFFVQEQMKRVENAIQNGNPFQKIQ